MSTADNRSNSTSSEELEAMRQLILDEMLEEAVFDGWTEQTLEKAATAAGMDHERQARGDLKLAFPNGVVDVLDFWSEQLDQKMLTAFEEADPAPERIRDKVTLLVKARLQAMEQNRESARRAAATMALPHHAGLGARLSWRTSDTIWRALGDTSTDYNYYTKRTTLNAVYLSTLSHWMAEEVTKGEGAYESTWAFLDKRIENIMQFEKVKAKVLKRIPAMEDVFGSLAKFRYGAGK